MFKKLFKKNWTLYLYYNGILVKKVRISETEIPIHNSYVVRVWFKKNLFGSNVATVILRPVELLRNDDERQHTHYGAIHERGVEM